MDPPARPTSALPAAVPPAHTPDPTPNASPPPAEDTDAVLLARYAAGDLEAARSLMALHLPRVLGLAHRLLGDATEAEDIAQEAMVRLWRIAPDWQAGRARLSTWLHRVTANLCTDRLRQRRGPRAAAPLEAVAEPADPAPGVERALIDADRATALSEALSRLPQRQAQAVTLRHLEGLGNPEIARIMDTGTEAVESLVARGRRALQAALAPRRDILGYDDDRP
ncbi:sigma-70 family RNA polymerase sigma factor [Rhodobaculum claviforme]|uniref:RNA polymerase subunit sigma n=1 Tax=Rhodobaculum claviforme TaxID=1549854 RepID=A0A934TLJ4_9RHOB|nr:sigma-70 family RNA polymerase sigma factor [Rhodobaculum claviforme]MBK5927357.1 RNA polymerase subunit sigma [Rhodobaculum claviforme]